MYTGSDKNPLSLTRHTYGHNNPVNYDDPSGHIVQVVAGALYLWGTMIITSPDLQWDMQFLAQDFANKNPLALDLVSILVPGLPASVIKAPGKALGDAWESVTKVFSKGTKSHSSGCCGLPLPLSRHKV